jgi:hypothetical protein
MLMRRYKRRSPHIFLNVEQIPWHRTKKGDRVFIPGNMEDGFATAIYGPHYIEDPKKQTIRSGFNQKIFHEDFPLIYREMHKQVSP